MNAWRGRKRLLGVEIGMVGRPGMALNILNESKGLVVRAGFGSAVVAKRMAVNSGFAALVDQKSHSYVLDVAALVVFSCYLCRCC